MGKVKINSFRCLLDSQDANRSGRMTILNAGVSCIVHRSVNQTWKSMISRETHP